MYCYTINATVSEPNTCTLHEAIAIYDVHCTCITYPFIMHIAHTLIHSLSEILTLIASGSIFQKNRHDKSYFIEK